MMMSTQKLHRSWQGWLSHSEPRIGPRWLQFVWTFVFAAALAVGFTILGFTLYGSGEGAWRNLSGWWEWYRRNLVICVCVAFTIHLLFDTSRALLGKNRVRNFSAWQRLLYFTGVPMLGVALATPLGLWLAGIGLQRWLSNNNANSIVGSLLLSLLLIFLFYQFFAARSRQFETDRQVAEARLQLLQAQIEPHFLFNTLANVVGLMDADTARARLMLESFIDYLRASLGNLRQEHHTLGDEIDLVEAYLRIIKIRMDDRLDYTITLAHELRALPLPALTLQPLVENAVHHGLEPKIEGGRIDVAARLEGGRLVLTVLDDGLGLHAPAAARRPGTGTALANIRERLDRAHGAAAGLSIEPRTPHGVRATLHLPLKETP